MIAWIVLLFTTEARADILINEVMPNPMGVDSGYEWIEIVNNGAVAVNLNGWLIERSTTGFYSIKYTFPNVDIQPGEHLVVGEEFVTDADLNLAPGAYFSFGNATLSGDAIHLCDPMFNIIDTLVYGPNNTDGFVEDSGNLAIPAPGPMEDESVARDPDGVDTDDSGADFVVDDTPTPGLDNAWVPPPPMAISMATPGVANANNTWTLTDGAPSCNVVWVWGSALGATPIAACPGATMGLASPKVLGKTATDAMGYDELMAFIPAGASGNTMYVQAITTCDCAVTDVVGTAFP